MKSRFFLPIALAGCLCLVTASTAGASLPFTSSPATVQGAHLEGPVTGLGVTDPVGAQLNLLLRLQEQQPSQPQTDPPKDTDRTVTTTTTTTTRWYANPVWVALGALAIVVVVLLIAMLARSGNEGGATVVHQK